MIAYQITRIKYMNMREITRNVGCICFRDLKLLIDIDENKDSVYKDVWVHLVIVLCDGKMDSKC